MPGLILPKLGTQSSDGSLFVRLFREAEVLEFLIGPVGKFSEWFEELLLNWVIIVLILLLIS